MGKSAAFARIKTEVLTVTHAVPQGCVTTYASLGQHLGVMARHVAYILAMLTDDERQRVPWYRVVGDGGLIKTTNRRWALEQKALLETEGIHFRADAIVDFQAVFVNPTSLILRETHTT